MNRRIKRRYPIISQRSSSIINRSKDGRDAQLQQLAMNNLKDELIKLYEVENMQTQEIDRIVRFLERDKHDRKLQKLFDKISLDDLNKDLCLLVNVT